MKRLTKKNDDASVLVGIKYQFDTKKYDAFDLINKLGEIEDFVEKLALPFPIEKIQEITEIYALNENNELKKYKIIGFNFNEKQIYFWMGFCPMYLSFSDYKKYFWLKEDRSE